MKQALLHSLLILILAPLAYGQYEVGNTWTTIDIYRASIPEGLPPMSITKEEIIGDSSIENQIYYLVQRTRTSDDFPTKIFDYLVTKVDDKVYWRDPSGTYGDSSHLIMDFSLSEGSTIAIQVAKEIDTSLFSLSLLVKSVKYDQDSLKTIILKNESNSTILDSIVWYQQTLSSSIGLVHYINRIGLSYRYFSCHNDSIVDTINFSVCERPKWRPLLIDAVRSQVPEPSGFYSFQDGSIMFQPKNIYHASIIDTQGREVWSLQSPRPHVPYLLEMSENSLYILRLITSNHVFSWTILTLD